MAGERVWETGCPSTASRFIAPPKSGSTAAVRGRPAGVVGGHEPVELRSAGGGEVLAVAVRPHNVVEVVPFRRAGRRLDRGEPRIADRGRWQAGVGPRVVGRGRLQLG